MEKDRKHLENKKVPGSEKHRRDRTPAEEKAVRKAHRENKRKRKQERLKRKQAQEMMAQMDQNEDFFFIAGYTSGGAPYGVTWEEMGLEPWETLDDVCDKTDGSKESEESYEFLELPF